MRKFDSIPSIRIWIGAAVLAVAIFQLGCFESFYSKPKKGLGSSLWVDSRSDALLATDIARLKEVGIGELYVAAGRLESDLSLVPLDTRRLPRSIAVTMVIEGSELPPGAEQSTDLASAIRRQQLELEGNGSVVVGLHFDLLEVDSLERYARFLEMISGEMDHNLFLSVSLWRDWLDREEVADVVDVVDHTVPFLYGQRIWEKEEGAAWDFVDLEGRLDQLENLGGRYQLGFITLGTATHMNSSGGVKARRTGLSLQQILWNRNLKLRPGFSLEGVNRRVYEVAAERQTTVASWKIAPGDIIRVVRAATSDLEELTRLLGAWEIPHCLGVVFHRAPGSDEKLSLGLDNLLNGLDSRAASPELELGATLQRRTGRGWLLRFDIHNANGEITELSIMDNNYLEIRAINGAFGRVEAGDFYRFDLYRTSKDGSLERTFRRSDHLRLHVPILEGRQTVSSGDIELLVQGVPELDLAARFLLPDGRIYESGPFRWKDGEIVGEDNEG